MYHHQPYKLIIRDRSVAIGLVVVVLAMGMMTSFSAEASNSRINEICFRVSDDDVQNVALGPSSASKEIRPNQTGSWAGQPVRTRLNSARLGHWLSGKSCSSPLIGIIGNENRFLLLCMIRL